MSLPPVEPPNHSKKYHPDLDDRPLITNAASYNKHIKDELEKRRSNYSKLKNEENGTDINDGAHR